MKNMYKTIYSFLLFGIYCVLSLNAQVIDSWQTTGDQSRLFQQQTANAFSDGTGSNADKIYIDADTKYQSIEGFGWTLTQGSAKLIKQLPIDKQDELLNELFNTETGLGSAIIRIGIGATDLSEYVYVYHETPNDWELNNFSLAGPDLDDLIPVLKKALAINPDIKILATPWTAPKWMKNSDHYIGGKLKTDCYAVYAKYFIKYFEAMKAHGISIWAVTPQNEPLHDGNEPSMHMLADEQYDFVHNHLGPAIAGSEFSHVKIIAYDHNCDRPDYAIRVCESDYVDGAAFHLYDEGMNIGALTQVKNTTGKNVYFTEQYTGPGSFMNDFAWHMENVMLGSMNNYARIALEWNLAANSSYEPHTPGGCDTCLGGITIDNSSVSKRNTSYYLIAQMSKVTQAGAFRLKSTTSGSSDLLHTAFSNPDGSTSLVVFNKGDGQKTFDVVSNGSAASFSLPGKSAVSMIWSAADVAVPVTGVNVLPVTAVISVRETLQLSAAVQPADATIKTVKWSSSNSSIVSVDATGMIRGVRSGTATITVTTVNEGKTAVCEVQVDECDNCLNLFPDIYNLIAVHTNKALDVKDQNINPGAGMQQWDVENGGGDNQRWLFENVEGDVYYIKSKFSDLYLTAVNLDNGTTVTQELFTGNTNQEWEITFLENRSGNDIYKIINIAASKALDVDGSSDGSKVQIWTYNTENNDNQKWMFVKVEDGLPLEITNLLENEFAVYPNPVTSGTVYLTFNSEKKRSLNIYSLTGEVVSTYELSTSSNRIDLSALANGLYIFKVKEGDAVYCAKILKR